MYCRHPFYLVLPDDKYVVISKASFTKTPPTPPSGSSATRTMVRGSSDHCVRPRRGIIFW